MRKPQNFDKLHDTTIWWFANKTGKQVEAILLPAEYEREGIDKKYYSTMWLMELEPTSIHPMTHRMLLEIHWNTQYIYVHMVKDGIGVDGVVVGVVNFEESQASSYRTFVKLINSIAVRYSDRFYE